MASSVSVRARLGFDKQTDLIIIFELFYAILTKFKLLIKKDEGFFSKIFRQIQAQKFNKIDRAELKAANTELSEKLMVTLFKVKCLY